MDNTANQALATALLRRAASWHEADARATRLAMMQSMRCSWRMTTACLRTIWRVHVY
jgi:hypothetical protein